MLIAVTGTGGTGASTVAVTVARFQARRRPTVLVDLKRHGGLRHWFGVGRFSPGVAEIHAGCAFDACLVPVGTRMMLLPGLRDPSDWTTITDAAPLAAALGELRDRGATVVCDVGSDLEGAGRTGSLDVEDRHLAARTAAAAADVVLVVTAPNAEGLWQATETLRDLDGCGLDAGRVGVVVARAPNRRARRSLHLRTQVMAASVPAWPPTDALVLPERRAVRRAHTAQAPSLPATDQRRLAAFVNELARPHPARAEEDYEDHTGLLLAPGSLGLSWWRVG